MLYTTACPLLTLCINGLYARFHLWGVNQARSAYALLWYCWTAARQQRCEDPVSRAATTKGPTMSVDMACTRVCPIVHAA